MNRSAIPQALREQIRARDGDRCRYCRLHQHGQVATFHVDHIVPRAAGGETVADNLALLCPHCNLCKASKVAGMDPQTGESVAIFHPLIDQWDDHFAIDASEMIQGRTRRGRATVDALSMNDDLARRARIAQRKLGLSK